MAAREIDPVSRMTSEEALGWVRRMQAAFPETPRSTEELAALQKYLAQFTEADLREVGRRILSDLMQRPPHTINAGDLPLEPPARSGPRGAPPGDPSVGSKTNKGTKARRGPDRKRTAGKARSARRRPRR